MKQRWKYATRASQDNEPSIKSTVINPAHPCCFCDALTMPAVVTFLLAISCASSDDSRGPRPVQVGGHGRFLIPTRVTSHVLTPRPLPVSSCICHQTVSTGIFSSWGHMIAGALYHGMYRIELFEFRHTDCIWAYENGSTIFFSPWEIYMQTTPLLFNSVASSSRQLNSVANLD